MNYRVRIPRPEVFVQIDERGRPVVKVFKPKALAVAVAEAIERMQADAFFAKRHSR